MMENLAPFDPERVQRGDRVVLATHPRIPLLFEFMGHGSDVVVRFPDDFQPDMSPRSTIVKRRDLRVPA